MSDGLTIKQAKEAKAALEKEMARLIEEFSNICRCEVKVIRLWSAVWDADQDRPLAYRVEVETKL